jgi:autoinducer 2 (AI-2) kinase
MGLAERFLVGLDVGGGGGRCLVVACPGGAITTAFRPWSFPASPGAGPGAVDADLEAIWRALAAAAASALSRAGARPSEVAGIAATAMRLGAVVLGEGDAPLYAAPNRDARAAAHGHEIAAEHGAELLASTGRWPLQTSAAARLRWLAARDPAGFARASTLLALNDWVAFRLCGELATDFSQAGETFLFDLSAGTWAWDWIDRLGLPRRVFPELRPAGERLGGLRAEAAAALGLEPGTPVAVGGADTPCGLLGVAALHPGAAAAIAGTTAPIERVLDRPLRDPEGRLWAGLHVVPGRFTLESNAGLVGESLDWLAHLLHPGAEEPVAALFADAEAAPPGARGFLSTFGARIHDARVPFHPVGAFLLPRFRAPDGRAARGLLARAALEGVAYAFRANLEQLEGVAGAACGALRLGGGLSRSPFVAQLLADVAGLPVEVTPAPESSALGAAICAGLGAGLFEDLAEGARALVGKPRAFDPDPARARRYADLYAGWERLRAAQEGPESVARELLARP